MTETISAFARRHGLSRSTLLYYERIGLVRPSGRTGEGHRLYGPDADARMRRVALLREAGLPLVRIRALIDAGEPSDAVAAAVEDQLAALNRDLAALNARRRALLGLLARDATMVRREPLTKALWVALLTEAGLDRAAMTRWHRAFEREAPDDHAGFLATLGLGEDEIEEIRRQARGPDDTSPE